MSGLTPLVCCCLASLRVFWGISTNWPRQCISSGCSGSVEKDPVKFIQQRSGCLISGRSVRLLQNGSVRLEKVFSRGLLKRTLASHGQL